MHFESIYEDDTKPFVFECVENIHTLCWLSLRHFSMCCQKPYIYFPGITGKYHAKPVYDHRFHAHVWASQNDKGILLVFKLARRVHNWKMMNTKYNGPFDSFWLINDAQTNEAKVWPRLQYAFESRVFGMSCILYRLTQLAAFFLDQRAEWSTTNSCYCLLNLSWRHHQWWCHPNCKLGKSFWFWLKLGLDNEKASFRKPFIILNALKAHNTQVMRTLFAR